MPDLAKAIRVERLGRLHRLLIDGEEFPYHLSSDGVEIAVRDDHAPSVRITLVAERVEVVDAPFERQNGDSDA